MKEYLSLREAKERLQAIPETGMWEPEWSGRDPRKPARNECSMRVRTGIGEIVGSFQNTLMGVCVGVAAELMC